MLVLWRFYRKQHVPHWISKASFLFIWHFGHIQICSDEGIWHKATIYTRLFMTKSVSGMISTISKIFHIKYCFHILHNRDKVSGSTRKPKRWCRAEGVNEGVWWLLQLSVEMWGTRTKSSVSQEEFLLLVLPADSLDSCRKLGGPSGGDDRPSSAKVCMSGRDCVHSHRQAREKRRDEGVAWLLNAIKASRQSSADCQTNVITLLQKTTDILGNRLALHSHCCCEMRCVTVQIDCYN